MGILSSLFSSSSDEPEIRFCNELQAILDRKGRSGYFRDGRIVIQGGEVVSCFDYNGFSFRPGDRAYVVRVQTGTLDRPDGSEEVQGPVVYDVAIRGNKLWKLSAKDARNTEQGINWVELVHMYAHGKL